MLIQTGQKSQYDLPKITIGSLQKEQWKKPNPQVEKTFSLLENLIR